MLLSTTALKCLPSKGAYVLFQVDDYLNEYAAKFWVAKQPRKLVWMKHLGTVELSLKVHGISRDFTVSPFEASILMLFKVNLIRVPTPLCGLIDCAAALNI